MALNNKLFLGIITIILSFNCNAQLLNKLKKKVKDKIEDKVVETVDKKTDKTLEDITTNKKPNIEQDVYVFNQSILLELSANDNEKTTLEFFFSKQNSNISCIKLGASENDAMEGDIYNVLTPDHATVFMDLPGMKIKKSITDQDIKAFDNSDKIPPKAEIKKTGNTKTILGYLCHEYSYTKENSKVLAWVVKGSFPIKSNYLPILGMHTNSPYKGFVLELYYESANETGSIKALKIKDNITLEINTNHYKSM